jgi:hypothetical protein
MISGSVSIYKSIIAQQKESGGSLQNQELSDVLKQRYLKSKNTLVELLRERDEKTLNEVRTRMTFNRL